MAALCNRCGHYIFAVLFLSSFFFFFPHLISAVGDWMSTILPYHNLECMSEMCCKRLAEIQDANYNVGQYQTWWSPCRIQVVPSVQRRKVWLTPLLACRAVTLPRHESHWNLQRCPKLAKRSQPLGGRSSPYYDDVWGRYRCLTSFFRLSIHASTAKIQPDKVVRCAKMAIFCVLYYQRARVQHISDMHSKFALRPHHVWKYGRHPISDRWD